MEENEISGLVVDAAIKVHRVLGSGLLESVYERALAYELEKRGLSCRCQVGVPVRYEDIEFEEGFRADLIVEEKVIIELKSIERLLPVHGKRLLTYLRLSGKRLGLILNFGEPLLKNGIVRVVNGLLC